MARKWPIKMWEQQQQTFDSNQLFLVAESKYDCSADSSRKVPSLTTTASVACLSHRPIAQERKEKEGKALRRDDRRKKRRETLETLRIHPQRLHHLERQFGTSERWTRMGRLLKRKFWLIKTSSQTCSEANTRELRFEAIMAHASSLSGFDLKPWWQMQPLSAWHDDRCCWLELDHTLETPATSHPFAYLPPHLCCTCLPPGDEMSKLAARRDYV